MNYKSLAIFLLVLVSYHSKNAKVETILNVNKKSGGHVMEFGDASNSAIQIGNIAKYHFFNRNSRV